MTALSNTPSSPVPARLPLFPHLKRRVNLTMVMLALIVIGFAFLLPFYWMIISSLRPLSEWYARPIPLFLNNPSPSNYVQLFQRADFARGALNTVILCFFTVTTQVFFCSLAGYTFAKLRFKGREGLFIFILGTMMIPSGVGMIPNFIIMSRLHWIDTYLPLIIPGIANAFGIFWMRQYCQSIPEELLDAARIDGCDEFGIFWRIVIPIIQPALASLAIFTFLGTWNDFTGPLVFLRSPDKFTIQLWLSVVSRQANLFQPHLVMAGSVLSSIPIIILFASLQRYFMAGLTAGSLK